LHSSPTKRFYVFTLQTALTVFRWNTKRAGIFQTAKSRPRVSGGGSKAEGDAPSLEG